MLLVLVIVIMSLAQTAFGTIGTALVDTVGIHDNSTITDAFHSFLNKYR